MDKKLVYFIRDMLTLSQLHIYYNGKVIGYAELDSGNIYCYINKQKHFVDRLDFPNNEEDKVIFGMIAERITSFMNDSVECAENDKASAILKKWIDENNPKMMLLKDGDNTEWYCKSDYFIDLIKFTLKRGNEC